MSLFMGKGEKREVVKTISFVPEKPMNQLFYSVFPRMMGLRQKIMYLLSLISLN